MAIGDVKNTETANKTSLLDLQKEKIKLTERLTQINAQAIDNALTKELVGLNSSIYNIDKETKKLNDLINKPIEIKPPAYEKPEDTDKPIKSMTPRYM